MTRSSDVAAYRCRDRNVIESFLAGDYFDFPICLFSKKMIHTTASWMASSESVFFMVSVVDGREAGFIFANTLGYRLWRKFALDHPRLLPDLLWTFAKQRMGRKWGDQQRRFAHALPAAQLDKMDELNVPTTNTPFKWSKPGLHNGYVELLYVSSDFRGRNVGPAMLRAVSREMESHGIRRVEAHIDPANYASVRAFMKAHWTVRRTPQSDFLAYITCGADDPHSLTATSEMLAGGGTA
jgi:GNAT superfamily N-acetyltransferase